MTHRTFSSAAARMLTVLALPVSILAACNDDDDPTGVNPPELMVEASQAAFSETDPFIGSDEAIMIEVRNAGGGDLTLTGVSLQGADLASFELEAVSAQTLGAGESTTFEVAFVPLTEGAKSATVVVSSDAPSDATAEVAITGQATRFQFSQVDRKGIPALNTVFNHPSGTAGFDKTAYNVATPEDDVATYTDQFETVLGAVGNADPSGTAALLLPDELPVSLAASPTSFAQLTGRALADDATDVALFVTVGDASLQSDNVDANDKAFLNDFPYVAAPHE